MIAGGSCGDGEARILRAKERGNVSAASTLEIADVLRQILDVGIGQGRGDGCHVARVVGSAPRLEVRQLLLDVLRPLRGDAGYLILADKPAEVAHRTEYRVGNFAARLDLGAVSLEFDRQGFLRCEK